jgi:uncharacterized protein
MNTISQKTSKLIKNMIFSALVIGAMIVSDSAQALESYKLRNPAKTTVTLRLALTWAEHQQGLSGIKPKDFKASEGMLFVNEAIGPRRFWMPDTYFNLDIIFLDKDLKIVGIESNVPHHPGSKEPPAIFRTKTYDAQFVLETKAGSPFSKKLKVGEQLVWESKTNLSEIVLKTRRLQ